MNTELLVLRTGGTGTLTVTVEPADATIQSLKWNSDNQAVATVDEKGVVTAVGTGSAVITAVSDDMGGISVSCLVVVSEKSDIYLEKLVSKDETELRAGDNAVYASPSNATMSNAEILYCDIEIPGDTATVSDAKEYQRFEAGKSQPVRSITWDDVVYTIWHAEDSRCFYKRKEHCLPRRRFHIS